MSSKSSWITRVLGRWIQNETHAKKTCKKEGKKKREGGKERRERERERGKGGRERRTKEEKINRSRQLFI